MKLIYDRPAAQPNGNPGHDAFVIACCEADVDYAVATEGECFARFTTPRSILDAQNPFTVTLRDDKVYFIDHFTWSGKEYELSADGLLDGKPSPVEGMTSILRRARAFVRSLPAYARGASTSLASRAGKPNIFLDDDEATLYFGDTPALTARRDDDDSWAAEDPVHRELHRLLASDPIQGLGRSLRILQYQVMAPGKVVSPEDHEGAKSLVDHLTKIHRLVIEQEGRDRAAAL